MTWHCVVSGGRGGEGDGKGAGEGDGESEWGRVIMTVMMWVVVRVRVRETVMVTATGRVRCSLILHQMYQLCRTGSCLAHDGLRNTEDVNMAHVHQVQEIVR